MNFKVRVSCMTFNQSSYIIDTMNGFCAQETSFPFVCTIIDDASTDGEQETISNYVQKNFISNKGDFYRFEETEDYIRICSRHKENVNCYFVVLLLKYNHYSIRKPKRPYLEEWMDVKYIAFCEGDDYWIDSQKLQKEVDFLEQHDEYAMVHTAYDRYYQDTGTKNSVYPPKEYWQNNDNLKWAIIIGDVMIGTATVLMRPCNYYQIKKDFHEDFEKVMMGDVQTWFHLARMSKIHFIPDITAVYRKNKGGLTSINSKKRFNFIKNAFEVHLNLGKKYGAPQEIINKIEKNYGGSVISTGIEYRLYKELIDFCKDYLPENKLRIMVFRIAKLLPFIDKRIVCRLTKI